MICAGSQGIASYVSRPTVRCNAPRFAPYGLEVCMKAEYTAVIKEVDDWWIGWIEEVPGVNCQEQTYEELVDSLKETLQEALAASPLPP